MRKLGPLVTLGAAVLLASGIAMANAGTATPTASQQPAAPAGVVSTPADIDAMPAAPMPASTELASASVSPPAASSSAPVSPPIDYAGRVTGGRAALAVSVQDGKAVGYLCDGKTIEAWLYGTAGADGTLELTGKDGAALNGKRAEGHATGTVTAASRTWTFELPKTDKPGAIYRATGTTAGKQLRVGWVILPDGTQTGLATLGTTQTPAPRLDTTTGRVAIAGTPLNAAPLNPATTTPADL